MFFLTSLTHITTVVRYGGKKKQIKSTNCRNFPRLQLYFVVGRSRVVNNHLLIYSIYCIELLQLAIQMNRSFISCTLTSLHKYRTNSTIIKRSHNHGHGNPFPLFLSCPLIRTSSRAPLDPRAYGIVTMNAFPLATVYTTTTWKHYELRWLAGGWRCCGYPTALLSCCSVNDNHPFFSGPGS